MEKTFCQLWQLVLRLASLGFARLRSAIVARCARVAALLAALACCGARRDVVAIALVWARLRLSGARSLCSLALLFCSLRSVRCAGSAGSSSTSSSGAFAPAQHEQHTACGRVQGQRA